MRSRKAYRPTLAEGLESRLVLSGAGVGFRGTSILLQGLHPRSQQLGPRGTQSVMALTNKAFDLFVEDYTQARSTYLSTLKPDGNGGKPAEAALAAFKTYTSTRVDLLGQQVVSNVLQSPATSTKQRGNSPSVQTLVFNNINGRDPGQLGNATLGFRPRTLGNALITALPPANSTPEAAALSALAQDQAIEAARVGTINGLTIMRNGDFGNRNKNN